MIERVSTTLFYICVQPFEHIPPEFGIIINRGEESGTAVFPMFLIRTSLFRILNRLIIILITFPFESCASNMDMKIGFEFQASQTGKICFAKAINLVE